MRLKWIIRWVLTSWMSAHVKPLSWDAAFTKDLYEIEIDRQIILGVYRSNIPHSLGGWAVINGVSYQTHGYSE